MDIYKYQNFFREGKLDKPMPHLIIISDEFAELKSQQPEFMADLVSAARIGRALGVHLILATQKPSGVVSDEIWANSKFKLCLKVQNPGDSNEMIKTPDASQLVNAGRFYLLVGNNEIYVLGQSGWAGTRYKPSPVVKTNYDRSITVIDEVGNTIKNISDTVVVGQTEELGDELLNILKYIVNIANTENVKVNSLWLDNIPEKIYVDKLIDKYSFNDDGKIIAILGEYDNPELQQQGLLTLELNEEGNSLFYGSSGTDREMMFSAILYSLCTRYTSKDINIYIIDCGSESFGMFANFPQVGDIATNSENDKISKLFELLKSDIESRKKLFANYNGSYKTYCKSNENKVPLKIVMINNFDTFRENHELLADKIGSLSREGGRYGIIFLINATRGRSIYYSISSNFYHNYVMSMTERMEYSEILGKIGNLYPAEYEGRGIFKEDVALEFQTASIYDGDSVLDFINDKAKQIISKEPTKAPAIPVLPDEVTMEMLDKYMVDINKIPLGISKNRLEVVTYNFFKEKANIISSKNISSTIELLRTIITAVRKTKNFTVLIDTEQQLSDIGGIVDTYVDKNFEEFILSFEQFLDKEVEGKSIKLLCIIAGLERFQGSINSQKFDGFFNGIKTFDNVSLIFVDSSYKLKKVAFEQWYSSVVNNTSGIWIGHGFSEQAVINVDGSVNDKYIQKNDFRFAYVVRNGESELIKCLGGVSKSNEE